MRGRGGRWRRIAFFAVLFASLSALYAPALPYGLNLDDREQLDYVRQFGPVHALDSFGHVRPLKNALFWGLDRLFGDDLRGWRAAALGVFFVHLVVVAAYLERVLGSSGRALAGTAAYGVLAVHSSVVPWISAFNIVVFALFMVLALLWADVGCARRSGVFLALSCGALAVAVAAYEAALVFPAVLALQSRLLGRGFRYRSGRIYLAAVAAMVAAGIALRFIVGGRLAADAENLAYPPGGRGWLALSSARYLLLHLYYALDPWTTFGVRVPDLPADHAVSSGIAWVVLVAAVAVALWGLLRKRSRAAFGFLLFCAGLAPLCNFIPVGSGPVADYFLFFPSIGLVVTGVAAVGGWLARARAVPVRVGVASVVAAWMLANVWAIHARRLPAWETRLTLVEHAADVQGPGFYGDFVAARLELSRRHYVEAARLYSRALERAPYHAPSQAGYVVALINAGELGPAEDALGKFEPPPGEPAETLRLCRALLLESRGRFGPAAELYRDIVMRSPATLEAKITALVRLELMKRRRGVDPGVPYRLDRAPFDIDRLYLFPGYAEP